MLRAENVKFAVEDDAGDAREALGALLLGPFFGLGASGFTLNPKP